MEKPDEAQFHHEITRELHEEPVSLKKRDGLYFITIKESGNSLVVDENQLEYLHHIIEVQLREDDGDHGKK